MPLQALVFALDGARRDLLYGMAVKYNLTRFLQLGANASYADCAIQPILTHQGHHRSDDHFWMTCAGMSSITTGNDNDVTQVRDNSVQSIKTFWKTCQEHPTFLRVAHDNGFKTFAVGRPNVVGTFKSQKKDDLGILNQDIVDGKIDFHSGRRVMEGDAADAKHAELVVRNLQNYDVMFVHIDAMDQNGHAHGWGSKEYLKAIIYAHKLVDKIMTAVEREGLDPVILATADHGGYGRMHGTHEKFDRCIPLMANFPLPTDRTLYHYDVAPTVLDALNIPPDRRPRMKGQSLLKHLGSSKKLGASFSTTQDTSRLQNMATRGQRKHLSGAMRSKIVAACMEAHTGQKASVSCAAHMGYRVGMGVEALDGLYGIKSKTSRRGKKTSATKKKKKTAGRGRSASPGGRKKKKGGRARSPSKGRKKKKASRK